METEVLGLVSQPVWDGAGPSRRESPTMGFRFWERSSLTRVWRVTDQGHNPVSHSDLHTLIPAHITHTHIHHHPTHKVKNANSRSHFRSHLHPASGIGDFCSLCFQGWCVLTGHSNGLRCGIPLMQIQFRKCGRFFIKECLQGHYRSQPVAWAPEPRMNKTYTFILRSSQTGNFEKV